MIALIFSLILDFRVPIDYYYKEPNKTGINKPMNRKQRRGNK